MDPNISIEYSSDGYAMHALKFRMFDCYIHIYMIPFIATQFWIPVESLMQS